MSSQQQTDERCLVCRQPAPQRGPRGDGGSILCTMRGDTLHLVGPLCNVCKEHVGDIAGPQDEDEDEDEEDGSS